MHHSPTGIEYLRGAGIDLVLAGHTHGGQVFPGPWVAALRYDEVSGLYPGATQVYVSEGLGTFVAKSRIGTSNQLDVLHLVPGD